MRTSRVPRAFLGATLAATLGATAQGPPGDPLTNAGIQRAAARLDSVFVSRTTPRVMIKGGDFGSYLIARLGVVPIPADLTLRVVVNREHLALTGRLRDVPLRARDVLGPMFAMLPLDTPVAAEIEVARVERERLRFRLATVRVNHLPVPGAILSALMSRMAREYGAPSESGRDLMVRIPPDGNLELVTGWVRVSRSTVGDGGRL
ncbi:MAG: hypothetical protein HYW06_02060 [Gemmatimonadetes bacterium]|nr:hypothetical protein [Gemmatimonadota bacterium]